MSEVIDDRELVTLSCRGDTQAFEALYRRYGGKVFGIAWRLTLDQGQAEDLTQDAFVRIWQQLPGFRFESSLATWIYRVATNVVLGKLRTSPGVGGKLSVVQEEPEELADTHSGHDVGQLMDIERQLRALPERARMVLVMHDLAGMTHEEIGASLDIAPGTSKAQLFRARRLYRELESATGESAHSGVVSQNGVEG